MDGSTVLVVALIFDMNPRYYLLEGVSSEERRFLEEECHDRFVYLEAPDQDFHSVRRLGALLGLDWGETEDVDESEIGRWADENVHNPHEIRAHVDSVVFTGQKR